MYASAAVLSVGGGGSSWLKRARVGRRRILQQQHPILGYCQIFAQKTRIKSVKTCAKTTNHRMPAAAVVGYSLFSSNERLFRLGRGKHPAG